jgi:hypothetical protein
MLAERGARNGGGNCCVLFVGNTQCCDASPGWQDEDTDGTFRKKRQKYWLGMVGVPTRHNFPLAA